MLPLAQSIVDAAMHPMAVLDSRLHVVACNVRFRELAASEGGGLADGDPSDVGRWLPSWARRRLEALFASESGSVEFELSTPGDDRCRVMDVHATRGSDGEGAVAILAVQMRPQELCRCGKEDGVVFADSRGQASASAEPLEIEDQLRVSRQRFHDLADAIPQIVWTAGPDGGIAYLNARAAEYTGVSVDDLKGWSWDEVVHPDDLARTVEQWMEARRDGEPRDMEFRIRRRDGEFRWHITRQVPIRDSAGGVVEWYGYCTDIEELKRAEARLRDERTLLRAIIDAIPDMIFTKDREARFSLCNRATLEFFGARLEGDLLGKSVFDLFPPEMAQGFFDADMKVIRGSGLVTDREVVARNSRGQDEWRLMIKAPLQDHAGAVTGLVGISRNIQSRKEREERLAESRERLQLALTAAGMGTWDWDLRTDAVYRSPEYLGILGFPSLPPHRSAFEVFAHPEDLSRVDQTYRAAIERRCDFSVEFRVVRADGEVRWVAEIGRAHSGDSTAAVRLIGVIQDVTDRIRAGEAVRRSQSMLQLVLDNIPQGVHWKDREHRYVWCNSVVARALGLSHPSEVVGRTDADLSALTPAMAALHVEKDREAMESDVPQYRFLETTTAEDGRIKWLETSRVPIHDAEGEVAGVLTIWDDVSDRQSAEMKLREERDRLATIAASAPGVICSFRMRPDGSCTFPYASPKIVGIYGFSAESLAIDASPIFDAIHPEDVPAVRETIAESSANLTRCSITYRVCRGGGEMIWVEAHAAPTREDDGGVLWHGFLQDVTERMNAETKLRFQHALLQSQSEASPDGILVVDGGMKVLSINQCFLDLWKVPREVVDSGDDLRLLEYCQSRTADPDDLARHVALIEANPHVCTREEVALDDGRTIDRYSGPVRGADGEWLGRVWYFRDITERKLSEDAIRESEERYRRLVEVLPSALFIHSVDEILYCNRAFVDLVGAESPEELLGRDPFAFVETRHHAAMLARIDQMRRTGEASVGIEMRVRRLDGRSAPVFSATTPISGVGSNSFLVAISDLTERERSMDLLRSVMESVDDAIVTIDEQGAVHSANSAVSRLFGIPVEEVVGGNISRLVPAVLEGRRDEYIRMRLARPGGVGLEVEGRRKDGATFPVELTITEFHLDGERRYTGVLRDITGRKRLQTQFHQSQKMEAVGRLAGGVAHDFNNLLTVINGYSEILLERLPKGDDNRSLVVEIHKAGVRSAGLTRQLLAFSRQQILKPRVLDLNEVVRDVHLLLGRLIGEDVVLTTDLQPGLWAVRADQGQMEQVLMNLAVNARDAMPNGGRLSIETRNGDGEDSWLRSQTDSTPGPHVQLTISDSGCGMSPEVRARAFEPFFTTKGPGKGTGLGLATVYGIVKQSEGQVVVQSAEGVGTTLTIYLPRADQPKAAVGPSSKAPSPRGAETVMVVEDEQGVLTLARSVLSAAGYTVLEACDGEEADRIVANHGGPIHLLLCDVVMPGDSGRVVAERVSALHPEVRILYMSGYTDDAVVRKGVLLEKVNFLQKPFSPVALAIKVREVLDSVG